MKNMRIHNVSIHLNFDQNRFINEYAKMNFLNPRRDVRTDRIVRFRRTYVLNKLQVEILNKRRRTIIKINENGKLNSLVEPLISKNKSLLASNFKDQYAAHCTLHSYFASLTNIGNDKIKGSTANCH